MTDKATLKEAFLEGYETGRGVESLSDVAKRTAEGKFERWYDLNFSDEDDIPGSMYPAEVVDEDD